MKHPLNSSRALAAGLGFMLLCAAPVHGGSIANLTVTNLSSPDLFVDNPVIGLKQERRSTATLLSSNPTAVMPTFSARLAGLAATDTFITIGTQSTISNLSMQIDFDIIAAPAESWTMQIDQLRKFALTLVDDPGSDYQSQAVVDQHLGSYSFTPGASGPIAIQAALSEDTGFMLGNVDLPVNEINTNYVFGVGPTSVQLNFSQRLMAHSFGNNTIGPGQEAAVRFGIAGTMPGMTAEDYPGVGSRAVNNDGHFVDLKLTFVPVPEPASASLLAVGLLKFVARRKRIHS